MLEILGQGVTRDLRDRAGHFHPGRAAADDDKSHGRGLRGFMPIFSAYSKARSKRRRISTASSRLFKPGASFSHSSWPK